MQFFNIDLILEIISGDNIILTLHVFSLILINFIVFLKYRGSFDLFTTFLISFLYWAVVDFSLILKFIFGAFSPSFFYITHNIFFLLVVSKIFGRRFEKYKITSLQFFLAGVAHLCFDAIMGFKIYPFYPIKISVYVPTTNYILVTQAKVMVYLVFILFLFMLIGIRLKGLK